PARTPKSETEMRRKRNSESKSTRLATLFPPSHFGLPSASSIRPSALMDLYPFEIAAVPDLQRVIEPVQHRDESYVECELNDLRVGERSAKLGKQPLRNAIRILRNPLGIFDR